MNKKIMLLALGAVSAVLLALPAMASALVPLHLEPTPPAAVSQPIHNAGGEVKPFLSAESGLTITCDGFSGSANFEAGGTTGTMKLTFGPNCKESLTGGPCTNTGVEKDNRITTELLPFHLATVEHPAKGGGKSPGVLVTPNANTFFARFTCHTIFGTLEQNVTGNGVIGTIINPACNGLSTDATIKFEESAHGKQTHNKLVGTETIYTLTKGAEHVAQNATGTLTLKDALGNAINSKLVCT